MAHHTTENRQDVPPGLVQRYQEALHLWLRWNDAHQRIDANLFDARHDVERSAELLDQLDRLRERAVKLSNELLDRSQD